MDAAIHLRPARTGDLPAVAAFDRFADADLYGGDRAAEVAGDRCFVAVEAADADGGGGAVLGYVTVNPAYIYQRPFVEFLCVAPEARRRGVGRLLLRHAVAVMADRLTDDRRLFAATEDWNAPMRALLEREGWTPAGRVESLNRGGAAERFFYRDL